MRTVQRWEKTDGLPVRRGGPGERGAVVASKRAIGEWWDRRQASPANRPAVSHLALYLVLGAFVAAITATVPFLRQVAATDESPPRLGRLLAASTSEGHTVSSIPLDTTASGLALDPSGDLVYVALRDEHAVAVVSLSARRVIDRFEAVDNPSKLVVDAEGKRLVIAGSSEVGVFDLRRRTLARFAGAGGTIHDVYVSSDDRHVWTTLAQAGLKILDLRTGRWETVPTIGCPVYLSAAPSSRRLFVAYQCGGPAGRSGHDAIEIIDEVERTSILTRSGPPLVGSRLEVSPDEQHVWVDTADACVSPAYDRVGCPDGSGPVLHALRAGTLDPLLTVRIPGHSHNSTPIFFPDGTRLVLAGSVLRVIDRALGTVYESLPGEAGGGEFTPDGRRFVTIDSVSNAVLDFTLSSPRDESSLRDAATHWTGDGTANDVVGGAHPLSIGGVRFEPGRYGQALSFDGTGGGANFGRRLDANIASGAATYVAWIKASAAGTPFHIASRTGEPGWRWWITSEGQQAFCFERAAAALSCENGGLVGKTTIPPGRWSHAAVVRSDSSVRLFVDATEDASIAVAGYFQSPDPQWDDGVMRLGAGVEGALPFSGLIDEVILFRRVLSAQDLAAVMRATSLH